MPETRETKPNREQRRHPNVTSENDPPARDELPPNDLDVPESRAKNSGHKKETADNWNQ